MQTHTPTSRRLSHCVSWLALALVHLGCPINASDFSLRRIPVPAGPEDIALDLASGRPRIIVSADDRLAKAGRKGALGYIDLDSLSYRDFQVAGVSPEAHRPHGITLVSRPVGGGGPHLYVIEHAPSCSRRAEEIVRYDVHECKLTNRTALPTSRLLTSPNDLVATADGRVFVTNNPKSYVSTLLKSLLQIPFGDVLSYDPAVQEWRNLVKDRYFIANGIRIEDGTGGLVISTVIKPRLAFASMEDGKSVRRRFAFPKPLDNISPDGGPAAYLYLTGIRSTFKFIAASRSGKRTSPTFLYRIKNELAADPQLEMAVDQMGAPVVCDSASVCLEYHNVLYVGCIFKPYVTRVEGHQWQSVLMGR